MKVTSVGAAMLLLIVGNLIAVLSDSLIKSVANEVPMFQFGLFSTNISGYVPPSCLFVSKTNQLYGRI